MMVVTFTDMGITAKDFNGINANRANAAIINLAADRVNNRYEHPETAIETLYDWGKAIVNYSLHRVEIPATKFDVWMQINS